MTNRKTNWRLASAKTQCSRLFIVFFNITTGSVTWKIPSIPLPTVGFFTRETKSRTKALAADTPPHGGVGQLKTNYCIMCHAGEVELAVILRACKI